jgi:hypothetical protein
MDLTNRQTNIVNIITAQEVASLSTIRTLLPEPISIPTLDREITNWFITRYFIKLEGEEPKPMPYLPITINILVLIIKTTALALASLVHF